MVKPDNTSVSGDLSSFPTVSLIKDGYALFTPSVTSMLTTLNLVYCNNTFATWFRVTQSGIAFDQVFPALNQDRVVKRLEKRGEYKIYLEPDEQVKGIPFVYSLLFAELNWDANNYISVHVHDMSIVKEKDALIESHAKLIERSNRKLSRVNRRLDTENKRLGAELEVTRKLQKMLLPTEHELTQVEDLDLACFMEPADEVGGDYYDVLQHNGRVLIGIGDVTGHGLHSGVVMLMVQMGVRTLLASNETDPTQFLSVLNKAIYSNVTRMDADKSLTLTLLNYYDGEIRVSGQHEEIIVVRDGGIIERLDTIDLGFPIGLDDEIVDFIGEARVNIETGDGIVLYTDGITEAENISGELYEMERLCQVISREWAKPAETIKQAIVDDVYGFIGEQQVFDDITLVVIKKK